MPTTYRQRTIKKKQKNKQKTILLLWQHMEGSVHNNKKKNQERINYMYSIYMYSISLTRQCLSVKCLNASSSNFTSSWNVAANLIASLKKCYTFAVVNPHWTCKLIPSAPRCLFRPFIVIYAYFVVFSWFTCYLTSLLIMQSQWPRNVKQQ